MAFRTYLGLRRDFQHGVLGRMQAMTSGTGHVIRGVSARGPIVGRVRLVTPEAHCVLLYNGCVGSGAEFDDTRRLAPFCFYVSIARTMTGLTLQSAVPERAAGITGAGVFGTEQAHDVRVVVAVQARVSPLLAVRRSHRLLWTGACVSSTRRPGNQEQKNQCGQGASQLLEARDAVDDFHIRHAPCAVT